MAQSKEPIVTKKKSAPAAPAETGGQAITTFRHNLYRLRTEKGLSMSDLARKIWGETTDSRGHTVARNKDRISRWETTGQIPEAQNLALLAKALDVTVEELAPNLLAKRIEDDAQPAVSMTMIAGRPDTVRLVVNTFCTLAVASKVIALLSSDPHTSSAMAAA